jgi:hypothetical protein
MDLLKGYFSMFISHNTLNTKYISKLYRKRSPKKIFIGKGELKHTSNKVVITFYVYNTERISLKKEYKQLYLSLFSPKKKYILIKKGKQFLSFFKEPLETKIVLNKEGNILKDIKGNDIIIYNRPYTVEEFLHSPKPITTKISEIYYNKINNNEIYSDIPSFKQVTYYDVYFYIVELFINNLSSYINILNKYFEYLTKLVELKILNNHEKLLIFISLVDNFYNYNYPNYEYNKNIAGRKYIKNLYRLQYLLKFNNVKFEKSFSRKLIDLVENLYNKKVELNIVNLNQVHLNSDILTQAIVLKLKNKKNKLYKIFKSSLNKVKISDASRLSQKIDVSNKKNYFINNIRNVYINDMLNNKIIYGDSLNNLLLNYFSSSNKLTIEDLYSVEKSISLRDYIFRYIKHFRLAGVRLEARGRLSRRFTASRSVFKLN